MYLWIHMRMVNMKEIMGLTWASISMDMKHFYACSYNIYQFISSFLFNERANCLSCTSKGNCMCKNILCGFLVGVTHVCSYIVANTQTFLRLLFFLQIENQFAPDQKTCRRGQSSDGVNHWRLLLCDKRWLALHLYLKAWSILCTHCKLTEKTILKVLWCVFKKFGLRIPL